MTTGNCDCADNANNSACDADTCRSSARVETEKQKENVPKKKASLNSRIENEETSSKEETGAVKKQSSKQMRRMNSTSQLCPKTSVPKISVIEEEEDSCKPATINTNAKTVDKSMSDDKDEGNKSESSETDFQGHSDEPRHHNHRSRSNTAGAIELSGDRVHNQQSRVSLWTLADFEESFAVTKRKDGSVSDLRLAVADCPDTCDSRQESPAGSPKNRLGSRDGNARQFESGNFDATNQLSSSAASEKLARKRLGVAVDEFTASRKESLSALSEIALCENLQIVRAASEANFGNLSANCKQQQRTNCAIACSNSRRGSSSNACRLFSASSENKNCLYACASPCQQSKQQQLQQQLQHYNLECASSLDGSTIVSSLYNRGNNGPDRCSHSGANTQDKGGCESGCGCCCGCCGPLGQQPGKSSSSLGARGMKCWRMVTGAHVRAYLPIAEWLPRYQANQLFGDISAGFVTAVLNISTSLSAALVANVNLSVAFRSSIINTLVYSLLASSRHVSFGSWSIMSQMLLVSVQRALSDELVLDKLNSISNPNSSNSNNEATMTEEEYEKWHLNLIIMYTFLIGAGQLLAGILKLGNILSSFIPEALCSAMISATAIVMALGQVANMCGTSNKQLHAIERNTTSLLAELDIVPQTIEDVFIYNTFKWARQLTMLARNCDQINIIALIISLTTLAGLAFNQYLLQPSVERWLRKKLVLPSEMILLIIMILVSIGFNLEHSHSVPVTGPIEIDFKIPAIPNLSLIRELWLDSLVTALISYTMVFIMAKTYANKFNYTIDPNQELLACGAGNLIGGLFEALPATASFSRTSAQVEAGGKTQLASLINVALLLTSARMLGQQVAPLPVCVMAAMLFFGFARMTSRCVEAKKYYTLCKVDFSIWLVTFICILTLDLVNGFIYAFIYSIMTLLFRIQTRRCYLLGAVGLSDVYVPLKKYPIARELRNVKMFQFCGPIHYASADLFEQLLRDKTKVDVKQINSMLVQLDKQTSKDYREQLKALHHISINGNGNTINVSISPNIEPKKLKFKFIKPTNKQTTLNDKALVSNYDPCEEQLAMSIERKRFLQTLNLPTHIIIDFSMIAFVDTTGVLLIKKLIEDFDKVNVKLLCASLASHVVRSVRNETTLWTQHKSRFYVTLADAVHFAHNNNHINNN